MKKAQRRWKSVKVSAGEGGVRYMCNNVEDFE